MKHKTVQVAPHHSTLSPKDNLFAALRNTVIQGPAKKRLYNLNTITEQPVLFREVINCLFDRYRSMGSKGPTHILAVELFGYVIGAPLAMKLGIPFIPIRRGKITENSFVTEGDDRPPLPPMSVRHGSINKKSRVLIVDDYIASGKTMAAALDCAEIAGASIVEVFAICDLSEAGGIDLIRQEEAFKTVNIFTFFRLKSTGDVLCYYKNSKL